MRVLLQDARYGLRTLARSPGFSLMAVAVLALGIGVNATVFSLANALFLRPLPVTDPDTVVRARSPRSCPPCGRAGWDPLIALRHL